VISSCSILFFIEIFAKGDALYCRVPVFLLVNLKIVKILKI
jgi:hypothetical protein